MIIEKNDEILLEEENGSVYLTVFQKGCSFLQFHPIIVANPQLVFNVQSINQAITVASGERVHIGIQKPLLEWKISHDKMKASVRVNCTEEYFKENKQTIISQILNDLRNEKISEGIQMQTIQNELEINQFILVAKGTEPIRGLDAVVKYFKPSERKPTIGEDGKADFYDMNFLDEVKKGDWLGEKIPPTNAVPGKTITGDFALGVNGKNKRLQYDPNTVGTFEEDGKVVLRALIDGVVEFEQGKIKVGRHLVINGDVGVATGNISFDGNITIKGTVAEGYSVVATQDISILSELGVSQIELIESKTGDVYIKGGAFGKGKSKIRAGRNIFIKHANECILEAKENIHIGYYSLGSTLKARNIITDEVQGKLIGGVIEALGKVRAGIIGNKMERKTIINVLGFNRDQLKNELNELLVMYKSKMIELDAIKEKLEIFDTFLDELNSIQNQQYRLTRQKFDELTADILYFEQKRKSIMELLESKGDGEITIGQMAYPDTNLQIKNMKKKLNEATSGTFYAENNYMHFEQGHSNHKKQR